MINKQIFDELFFELNSVEQKHLNQSYEKFLFNLDLVKSFDLSKYEKYTSNVIEYTTLRDDIIISDDSENKQELFNNCVDFNNEYVVLKNEK